MSGGVDSSVAAMLLRDGGYDVVGVFMRCYNLDGCAERDAEDARRAAEHLKIPFYVWDFETEYKDSVVQYMIDGYRAGITPNPDVMCNKEIKFGLFLRKALEAGADHVATGHYVRIKNSSVLHAARDAAKDQSYFLWTLTQADLARCLFPIGEYLKTEVRALARKAGLPTAEKKDSQGVCFLGNITVRDFLRRYIPETRGALVTTTGEHIGEHSGAEFYTIGQRHIGADFRFPKTNGAKERKPFYVASKNTLTNTVGLAEGGGHAALYKKYVDVMNMNMNGSMRAMNGDVWARVRYRQPVSSAKLTLAASGAGRLVFMTPQKFIAPGQSAVWYSKEGELLGGGVIV